jgi:hypothetical protein
MSSAALFVCDDRALAVEMGALGGVELGAESVAAELGDVPPARIPAARPRSRSRSAASGWRFKTWSRRGPSARRHVRAAVREVDFDIAETRCSWRRGTQMTTWPITSARWRGKPLEQLLFHGRARRSRPPVAAARDLRVAP